MTASSQGSRRAASRAAGFETGVKAADPQELAAGLVTTATATVPIPMSAPPTMQGRYARYEWRVRARVEMKGNDPDSGWTDIAVRLPAPTLPTGQVFLYPSVRPALTCPW